MKTYPALSVFFLSLCFAASANAQTATPAIPAPVTTAVPANPASPSFARGIFPLETAWSFERTDVTPAASSILVNLPHDWSISGNFDADAAGKRGSAYLPTGTGHYRKIFTLPASDTAKHLEIQFDGITANGEVLINGHSLGKRPSPYTSVHYDLTPYVTFGADKPNTLDVNVDNSIQPVSRFYTGSGIERHVRLVVTNPVHVETNGLYVTTPTVTHDSATVHFQTYVTNTSMTDGTFYVEAMVHGADGKMLGATVKSGPKAIAAGKGAMFSQDITVANPKLWDTDHPNLYKAMVAVVNNAGAAGGSAMVDSRAVDVDATTFGIRKIEFKPETGFWLNDQNVKILGVCMHEDGGAVGEAVPRSVYVARISALKALGANAVRLSHNPPNPVELAVCDELGMMVMDEMFDVWTVSKPNAEKGYAMFFNDWSLLDLRDAVVRDRNHPSIILYSAGNEIHDTPKEEFARTTLWGLVSAFHQYDPSRPVTQALLRPSTSHDYTNGLADMLDVIGTNYRDSELVAAAEAVPTRKMLNTEEIQDAKSWVYVRDHPQLAGCFIWAGIDYLGEGYVAVRPAGVDDPTGAWPNISSGGGLLDRTLTFKPAALERQSWWATKPVVHLLRSTDRNPADNQKLIPHDTKPVGLAVAQPDWTPNPQNPYTDSTVYVLSNCYEVELFQDGKSLGTKTIPEDASPRTWQVTYAPGTLRAVGRNGGKDVAMEEQTTAGVPAKIVLTADAANASPSFEDVVFVHATVTDAKGVRVPYATNALTFKVTGPGTIIATDNALPDDHTPFPSLTRSAKDGRVLAYLRASAPSGKITISASADGLTAGSVTLNATPVK